MLRIKPEMIKAICQEYQLGRTVEEISIDSGIGQQNIRRALAEGGLITLNWYKTDNEIQMLERLASIGIKNIQQLNKAIK